MIRSTAKWFAAVLLTVSVLACEDPEEEIPGDILIFNGGVEEGLNAPDGWNPVGLVAKNHTLDWTLNTAAAGRRSLRIGSVSSALAPDLAYWYQPMPLEYQPNVDYVLSAKLKLDHLDGAGVAVALRGDDTSSGGGPAAAFATTQGKLLLTGSTGAWIRVAVRLSAVPANVNHLSAYLLYLPGTSGSVYFDDINIRRCASTSKSSACSPTVP
jgi:hypothetical protein